MKLLNKLDAWLDSTKLDAYIDKADDWYERTDQKITDWFYRITEPIRYKAHKLSQEEWLRRKFYRGRRYK